MASKACVETLKKRRSKMIKRALIFLAVIEFIVTAFAVYYMKK